MIGCQTQPMNLDRLSILLVGSNPSDAAMLQALIAEASAGAYQVEYVARMDTALTWRHEASFDAILLDSGDTQLIAQLADLRLHAPDTPIVALTSGEDEAPDLRALRSEEHTSELQSRPHLVCR